MSPSTQSSRGYSKRPRASANGRGRKPSPMDMSDENDDGDDDAEDDDAGDHGDDDNDVIRHRVLTPSLPRSNKTISV